MIHDSNHIAIAAVHALRDAGVELSPCGERMFHSALSMLISAATNKDAKDVSRTMSAFHTATYRDMGENVEAVSRIWRRYSRETVARIATMMPAEGAL